MTKVASVTLAVICTLTALPAHANKRSHLPMNANKLLHMLDEATASNDAPKVERILRTLVVLGHHGKQAISKRLRKAPTSSTKHILVALSRMGPDMRILAKPLLENKHNDIRAFAAIAMAGAKHEHLMRLYELEKDAVVKEALITSLAQSEAEEVTEFLIAQLQSSETKIRVNCINGLALRQAPAITTEMYAVIRDPEPAVRHAGIVALGTMGSSHTLKVLIDLARIESEKSNIEAIFDALRLLTGQHFGNTVEEWERWINAGS